MPSSSNTLTACTCWSSCNMNTSERSWLTLSVPSSLTSSSFCTGSTTPGSVCVCSRRWLSSSSPSNSQCPMETLPPSDDETMFRTQLDLFFLFFIFTHFVMVSNFECERLWCDDPFSLGWTNINREILRNIQTYQSSSVWI